MQCVNNLKQFGLAIHNYESSQGVIPPGRIWGPRPGKGPNDFPTIFSGTPNTPWFCLMLGNLEQQALHNAFNFSLGSEGYYGGGPLSVAAGYFANSTVAATKLALFQCPTDSVRHFQITPSYNGGALSGPISTKGNYAVSWGNTNWRQSTVGRQPYLQSAFGHDMRIGLGSVRDGLSSTVFVAEVLQGDSYDVRGMMWSSIPGGGSFMTRMAPNKFQDYLGMTTGGDQLNDTIFCVSEPIHQLPCVSINSDNEPFAAARSRHSGGINALFGDGSVKFLKDSINHPIWIALNTIENGEVLSADSY